MGEYNSARLDGVFNALCDPTRRAILARLTDTDARVTDIAADFPISLNSISKHIRMLERAGLVRRNVSGRDHVLSLNAEPMAEAAEWIERYRRFWEGRLAALDAYVTAKKMKPKLVLPLLLPRSSSGAPSPPPPKTFSTPGWIRKHLVSGCGPEPSRARRPWSTRASAATTRSR